MPILDPFTLRPMSSEPPRVVNVEDPAVTVRFADEITARNRGGAALLELDALWFLQIAGLVQLALRHPTAPESHRQAGAEFIDQAKVYFADCPTVLAILDAGNDPSQDVEVGQ